MTAKVKGGASGKLYGKVTGKEVAELLTALTGTEIDKKKVELPSAIKEFGSYDAKVRAPVGVVAAVQGQGRGGSAVIGGLVITFQQTAGGACNAKK